MIRWFFSSLINTVLPATTSFNYFNFFLFVWCMNISPIHNCYNFIWILWAPIFPHVTSIDSYFHTICILGSWWVKMWYIIILIAWTKPKRGQGMKSSCTPHNEPIKLLPISILLFLVFLKSVYLFYSARLQRASRSGIKKAWIRETRWHD